MENEFKRMYKIDQMLMMLSDYWHEHPELRLGQVVVNISGEVDAYYIEDNMFLDRIAEELDKDEDN